MDERTLYLQQLENCMLLCSRLERLLEEDSDEAEKAIRGKAGDHYKKACSEAISKTKQINNQIKLLISAGIAGY